MIPALALSVEAGDWPGEAEATGWFEAALGACADELGRSFAGCEISVVLTDDTAMAAINAAHRGIDRPTNVLSFPALPAEAVAGALDAAQAGGPPLLLGDLVFARGTIAREALAAGRTDVHHMQHLIVHGFLHLLGHDHMEDDEAEAMESLETRVLARLSIADPYAG